MKTRFATIIVFFVLFSLFFSTNSKADDKDFYEPSGSYVKTKPYIVNSGDTLWDLARAHGTSVAFLMALNPQIRNKNLIRIGQRINLPVPLETTQPQQSQKEEKTENQTQNLKPIMEKQAELVKDLQDAHSEIAQLNAVILQERGFFDQNLADLRKKVSLMEEKMGDIPLATKNQPPTNIVKHLPTESARIQAIKKKLYILLGLLAATAALALVFFVWAVQKRRDATAASDELDNTVRRFQLYSSRLRWERLEIAVEGERYAFYYQKRMEGFDITPFTRNGIPIVPKEDGDKIADTIKDYVVKQRDNPERPPPEVNEALKKDLLVRLETNNFRNGRYKTL